LRIVQLTPGTGSFYCGSCLRDGALARALTVLGHDVEMVPLYLPFVLEDHGAEERTPVHLGGINMYLQQKLPILRWAPGWLSGLLDAPSLLRWASHKSDMVGASQLGELTLSTLRGEDGRQAGEIAKLVRWLGEREPADVVCISNVMLIGIVRHLKRELKLPVVCTLQGEAPFLDALPEPYRSQAWSVIAERAGEVDLFVPVSHHYGELMRERLSLATDRVRVVHNGISLDDFS
jgi:glycosyltransferase involved in cell wall biosynthesis